MAMGARARSTSGGDVGDPARPGELSDAGLPAVHRHRHRNRCGLRARGRGACARLQDIGDLQPGLRRHRRAYRLRLLLAARRAWMAVGTGGRGVRPSHRTSRGAAHGAAGPGTRTGGRHSEGGRDGRPPAHRPGCRRALVREQRGELPTVPSHVDHSDSGRERRMGPDHRHDHLAHCHGSPLLVLPLRAHGLRHAWRRRQPGPPVDDGGEPHTSAALGLGHLHDLLLHGRSPAGAGTQSERRRHLDTRRLRLWGRGDRRLLELAAHVSSVDCSSASPAL